MVEEAVERDLNASELILSVMIGAVTILMISTSAGPAIVKPLLLDGSLISDGRYAFVFDAHESIADDGVVSVVGIGSSVTQYAMNGECMQDESTVEDARFYNLGMSGGRAYSEMIQIPALINAKPDVVMLEIGPNSLWGWNGEGWPSLGEYHEFRFQLLSMTMGSDDMGGWYDILESNDRKYIDTASVEVLDSWSEYSRDAIEEYLRREIDDMSNSLDLGDSKFVPPVGTDEWDQYLSKPNWLDSKFDSKSPEEIREYLDDVMPAKSQQGVYNPHPNGTQNHRAFDYIIHELLNASIEVVLIGVPHHPWVNGYLESGQLDGMNQTYDFYTPLEGVTPLQMYWEEWPSDAFRDRNHLDAEGREIFCKRVTPIIDAVLLGNDPSSVEIDPSVYDIPSKADVIPGQCVGSDQLFTVIDGNVSVEAEDYSHCLLGSWGAATSSWEFDSSFSNFSGSGYVVATPDEKVKVGDTTDGPRIGFNISFDQSGTYHVWVRMSGPSGSSDSIHLGLNGMPVTFGANGLGIWGPDGDTWLWKDTMGSRITIEVPSSGEHQFYIWMREDGVRVDSFVLTTDAEFVPAGA
ncbi:MAG: hypothetical protein VYC11_05125, partial [Candidatus Thermoplasmatota archaeon]|nr:hypothetical protein [Candidatus Thermoplasmatota archaeon]